MSFNSYEFIFLFLPVAVTGFWMCPRVGGSNHNALNWLLLTSVLFYAYSSLMSLAIIVPSILLDFGVASFLLKCDARGEKLRRSLFILTIAANVAFLCYFKYVSVFAETVNSLLATHFEYSNVMLPLGISFLTFQKVAFLADVYAGEIESVDILHFLLFTLFFPRTIAGPITRYREITSQFTTIARRDASVHIAVGTCLFSIGLFKKSVIADHLVPFVTPVFDPPVYPQFDDLPPTLITSWVALFAYVFQLYFDFSGYSDMAVGCARMFGVRLPINFNSPYKARSIVDFWNRWHITLTRFLTAYVYTPLVLHLTRRRLADGKQILRKMYSEPSAIWTLVVLPTLVTMMVSGLWHGAGWQFVVWGMLHGIYLSLNQIWRLLEARSSWSSNVWYVRLSDPLGHFLTFGAVSFALVFFRSPSVPVALSILRGILGFNGVLPFDTQLLQGSGLTVSWDLLEELLPLSTVFSAVALFLTVIVLPNSYELLGRLGSALEFGDEQQGAIARTAAQTDHVSRSKSRAARLLNLVNGCITKTIVCGAKTSWLAAAITALLASLGILAINRGAGFLYGGF
jgi:alginate O-acetyltransferase complex protein AlgI